MHKPKENLDAAKAAYAALLRSTTALDELVTAKNTAAAAYLHAKEESKDGYLRSDLLRAAVVAEDALKAEEMRVYVARCAAINAIDVAEGELERSLAAAS